MTGEWEVARKADTRGPIVNPFSLMICKQVYRSFGYSGEIGRKGCEGNGCKR
jgi:hypothetical protein